MKQIKINGKSYPCYSTMGAELRYKKQTGKEFEPTGQDTESWVTYIWARIVSACSASKVEAPNMSVDELADCLTPTDYAKWLKEYFSEQQELAEALGAELTTEKKKPILRGLGRAWAKLRAKLQ